MTVPRNRARVEASTPGPYALYKTSIPYLKGAAGLRRDDIVTTSFPKSGSTWLRFFLTNLLKEACEECHIVDFKRVDATLPELRSDNLLVAWPFATIPRFVKTHTFWWPLFARNRVVHIIRDPRDVMVSFYEFERAKRKRTFEGELSEFLRHRRYGLRRWFRHYFSWHERSTVTLKYEALWENDIEEFSRLFSELNISVDRELIEKAAQNSRFNVVKRMEAEFGKSREVFINGYNFTRAGCPGDWKRVFDVNCIGIYEKLCSEYGFDYEQLSSK